MELINISNKERVRRIINELELINYTDDSGDLHIIYQMKDIFVIVPDDENSVSLIMSGIATVDESDILNTFKVCNSLTVQQIGIKYVLSTSLTHVSVINGFYFDSDESLKFSIIKALDFFKVAITVYNEYRIENGY